MNDTTKAQAEEAIQDVESQEAAAGAQSRGGRDGFAVIEALNAENAALKDRVLRALAEMENCAGAPSARWRRQDLRA